MIRRVLVTGTITLTTVLITAAGTALAAPTTLRAADTADAPELSVQTVRPGSSFTLTPPTGCPSDAGEQVVYISYTDSEETTHQLASMTTDELGNWSTTRLRLPVAGLDDTGAWDDPGVTAGPGTIEVACLNSDYVAAVASRGSTAAMPGQLRKAVMDPPLRLLEEDPDDPGEDDENVTLSYGPASLTAVGSPARVKVTPGAAEPGGSVSVAPVDVCATASGDPLASARVEVSPAMSVPDDEGGEEEEDVSGLGAEADPDAIVSLPLELTDGSWPATELNIPADAELGDYAVTVDCLDSADKVSSRYEAVPLALGTAVAGAPVCSAKAAAVRLTGSFPGLLISDEDELELPATVRLTGSGPWTLRVDSALTGAALLKQKVSCPEPDHELTVSKTGLSASGAVRARVCNTGDAQARALLQVAAKGRKFAMVDRELLEVGDCSWLNGNKVKKGSSVRGRVLIDPEGKGSTDQEVAHTFTVRRPD